MWKILLSCVAVIVGVRGATMMYPPLTETVYGVPVTYCQYNQLKMLKRSVFTDYDTCLKCRCREDGLSCVSVAVSITVPESSQCISVNVACKSRWVMRDNNNVRCPRNLIPTEGVSAVGR